MDHDLLEKSRAALAKAKRHARTAAAVAALVPLAATALPTAAHATVLASTFSGTVTSAGNGQWTYSYALTNNTGNPIGLIELPEYTLNEFSGTVSGWTISQNATSGVVNVLGTGAATFKNNALVPQGYLDLGATGPGLSSGSTLNFTLTAATGNTIASNATLLYSPSADVVLSAVVDPPTPAPVPEPGTLALLGTAVLGFLGLRAKRHA